MTNETHSKHKSSIEAVASRLLDRIWELEQELRDVKQIAHYLLSHPNKSQRITFSHSKLSKLMK